MLTPLSQQLDTLLGDTRGQCVESNTPQEMPILKATLLPLIHLLNLLLMAFGSLVDLAKQSVKFLTLFVQLQGKCKILIDDPFSF